MSPAAPAAGFVLLENKAVASVPVRSSEVANRTVVFSRSHTNM